MDFKMGSDALLEPGHDDWVVAGLPTVCHVTDFACDHGGSFMGFHSRWKSDARLSDDDFGVLDHETYCRVLDVALAYDQLHLSQCACIGLICRALHRVQLRYNARFIGTTVSANGGEDRKKGGGRPQLPGDPDLRLLIGTSVTRGLVNVAPKLLEWVADKKHAEVLLLKEDRKLATERAFAAGLSKTPADDG